MHSRVEKIRIRWNLLSSGKETFQEIDIISNNTEPPSLFSQKGKGFNYFVYSIAPTSDDKISVAWATPNATLQSAMKAGIIRMTSFRWSNSIRVIL